MSKYKRPRLAVWKFASCDGCQMTLLQAEDAFLALAGFTEIAHFPEVSRATVKGPYDISLVEGSISTPEDLERLDAIRKASNVLIAIGACATAGGIQALRNFADHRDMAAMIYPRPEMLSTLARSSPIAEHVTVDFELQGCPVSSDQLLEVLSAFLNQRRPNIPTHSVCMECKRMGTVCVMVAEGIPCLGPVTQAGCGALCPRYRRGCFHCFGPSETFHVESLLDACKDMVPNGSSEELLKSFRSYYAGRSTGAQEGEGLEPQNHSS